MARELKKVFDYSIETLPINITDLIHDTHHLCTLLRINRIVKAMSPSFSGGEGGRGGGDKQAIQVVAVEIAFPYKQDNYISHGKCTVLRN